MGCQDVGLSTLLNMVLSSFQISLGMPLTMLSMSFLLSEMPSFLKTFSLRVSQLPILADNEFVAGQLCSSTYLGKQQCSSSAIMHPSEKSRWMLRFGRENGMLSTISQMCQSSSRVSELIFIFPLPNQYFSQGKVSRELTTDFQHRFYLNKYYFMKGIAPSSEANRTGIRVRRFESKGTKGSQDSDIDQLQDMLEQTQKDQKPIAVAPDSPIKLLPRAPPTPVELISAHSSQTHVSKLSTPTLSGNPNQKITFNIQPVQSSVPKQLPFAQPVIKQVHRPLPVVYQSKTTTTVPINNALVFTLGRQPQITTPIATSVLPNDSESDPAMYAQVSQMQKQIEQIAYIIEAKEERERLNQRRLEEVIQLKNRELKHKEEEIWRYKTRLEEMAFSTNRKAQELELMRQQLKRENEQKQQHRSFHTQGNSYQSWEDIPPKQRQLEIRKMQISQDEKDRNREKQKMKKTATFQTKWGNSSPTGYQLSPQEQFLSPLSVTFDMKPSLFIDDSRQYNFQDRVKW